MVFGVEKRQISDVSTERIPEKIGRTAHDRERNSPGKDTEAE